MRIAGGLGLVLLALACTPQGHWLGRAGDVAVIAGFSFAPVATEMAAYLTLRNLGAEADTLLAISSANADTVRLHEERSTGLGARMALLDRLVLPGHSAAEMAPGGLHLMLTGLRGRLLPGGELHLRLRFARGGVIDLSLPINQYGQQP